MGDVIFDTGVALERVPESVVLVWMHLVLDQVPHDCRGRLRAQWASFLAGEMLAQDVLASPLAEPDLSEALEEASLRLRRHHRQVAAEELVAQRLGGAPSEVEWTRDVEESQLTLHFAHINEIIITMQTGSETMAYTSSDALSRAEPDLSAKAGKTHPEGAQSEHDQSTKAPACLWDT